ncbi:MAG TPA: transglutaminase domain-containing protein, partial [Chloroflexi bacterium]|nr:transglutaminase domain-containing protein [Chloroflexota bacterium]
MARLLQRQIVRIDRRAGIAFALLAVALGSVAWGLARVVRGVEFGLLLFVGVLAMGWGALAQRWRWRGWLVVLTSLLLGVLVVLLRVGDLFGEVGRVGWLFVQAAPWQGAAALIYQPPDLTAGTEALAQLLGDLSILVQRMYSWSAALLARRPIIDPVASALSWSLLMWGVSTWAGWAMQRRMQPLLAVLPPGVLLVMTLSYAAGPAYILLVLLGATLLLMALAQHNIREYHWEALGIDFSSDIRVDLTVAAVLLSAGLVLMALIVPSIQLREIVDWARELTSRTEESETVAAALGVEQQPPEGGTAVSVFDPLRTTALPRWHLMGAGPELSEQEVLWIRTGELEPMPEAFMTQTPTPYYWRAMIYANYMGWGWYAGPTEVEDYEAGALSNVGQRLHHRRVRQEVQYVDTEQRLVFVTGDLVAVDQPYQVAWRETEEHFAATVLLPEGATRYRADSLTPVVSVTELRQARSDYPMWMVEYYMALPQSVPERVLTLARDLTATAPTPYDRAMAIQTYLRETYPYTLDVPFPPAGHDVADYFLFELREGYCDYYATAMVVLARAAGLPARLAVGYATGAYDAPNARYVVTEADAHAWVEV